MAVDLGKMVGPLPVGAWAGVVAGGLGIAYVARRNRAPVEAPPEYVYPAMPTPSGATILPQAPPTYPERSITTNSQWLAAAIPALVLKGYDPLKTQQCLQHFLEGTIPSGDPGNCRGAINDAIRELGPPPDGAPTNLNPLDPPKAPAKPPTVPQPAPPPKVNRCAGGGPVILYWYGNAMYLTNGKCRTQHGLHPRVADRYRTRYPAYGRPGHWGKVPRYNVLHQSIPQVFSSTDIAPIP